MAHKPLVAFVGHSDTGHLLKHVLKCRSLKEHITPQQLLGDLGEESARQGEILGGLELSKALVIGPSRQSLDPASEVFWVEQEAVTHAKKLGLWIALFYNEERCAKPPYLHAARDRVKLIITLGNRVGNRTRRHYLLPDLIDLYETASKNGHAFWRDEEERKVFPHHVKELSWRLYKLANDPRRK